MAASDKRALIIFPTYNEKENIEKIVAAVLDKDPIIETLIVDDNSPDGTGNIADGLAAENHRVHVVHREKKAGLGTAYIHGFKWAIANQYDYIFEMDADFSHTPKYLPEFLKLAGETMQITGTLAGVDAPLEGEKNLGELVDMEAVFEIRSDALSREGANIFGMKINGQTIFCDLDRKQLKALDLVAPLSAVDHKRSSKNNFHVFR
jgi:glycosyltransferase involved in cell wall biosynthesis